MYKLVNKSRIFWVTVQSCVNLECSVQVYYSVVSFPNYNSVDSVARCNCVTRFCGKMQLCQNQSESIDNTPEDCAYYGT